LLTPIIINEVAKRKHINALSDEQITIGLREVLEEIPDNAELVLA